MRIVLAAVLMMGLVGCSGMSGSSSVELYKLRQDLITLARNQRSLAQSAAASVRGLQARLHKLEEPEEEVEEPSDL